MLVMYLSSRADMLLKCTRMGPRTSELLDDADEDGEYGDGKSRYTARKEDLENTCIPHAENLAQQSPSLRARHVEVAIRRLWPVHTRPPAPASDPALLLLRVLAVHALCVRRRRRERRPNRRLVVRRAV